MKIDVEKIRSSNYLSDWLERYGVEVDRNGFAKCPFHNEKTASFRVYLGGTYHCFGCGAHGDVIDFVMSMQNLTFVEACKMLDRDITYSEQRRIDRIKRKKRIQSETHKNSVISYWSAFDEWKLNEDIISAFKPLGAFDKPNGMFLSALCQRAALTHKLNLAETEHIKRDGAYG